MSVSSTGSKDNWELMVDRMPIPKYSQTEKGRDEWVGRITRIMLVASPILIALGAVMLKTAIAAGVVGAAATVGSVFMMLGAVYALVTGVVFLPASFIYRENALKEPCWEDPEYLKKVYRPRVEGIKNAQSPYEFVSLIPSTERSRHFLHQEISDAAKRLGICLTMKPTTYYTAAGTYDVYTDPGVSWSYVR